MAETGPRLAVIAIGRNEGARLERCLRSLDPARLPVIYVDSGSTDGSQDLAARMGATVHALATDRPFTAARARAEGFAAMLSAMPPPDYVMFVDGDCEVEQGWLDNAAAFLDREPRYAVVCGRRRERHPDASPYNALIDREWATPVGPAEACGGDAVFRCRPYVAAGGFDPAMIAGEEPELCARLRAQGWRIMRLDAPMTIHDAAMERFSQWWRRAVRSGMGYAQAWWTTRRAPAGGLYSRELARAIAWAGLLPLLALFLALALNPWWLALWPAATLAQFLRLTARDGVFAARLAIAGKYAELIGILRFTGRALRGHTGGTVLYK
jgi:cellulose synthase/poly-beta-1,6-N-acetylglucosamine synthase-like glycosyltransferase